MLIMFTVFMVSAFIRPALPIDETRYLGVAWEMWLKSDWIHLTKNYVAYHHKPPLLFWLINIFWMIFGVSRWAATLVPVLSSIAVIFLTIKLAKKLFPQDVQIAERVKFLLLGSVPFLIYGSLIMFDMLMTVFVLGALLLLLEYAEKRRLIYMVGYGLCLGFGVLTKGPVIYIYALLPALLSFWWAPKHPKQTKLPSWIIGWLLAIAVSAVPVMLWLGPMLGKDPEFLYWLVWKQSAGRVTGNFSAAHGRPIYFYLPLIPLFLAPWILFSSFWKGANNLKNEIKSNNPLRCILIWIGASVISFSFISGKQPHYLVPILPGMIILAAYFMRDVSQAALKKTTYAMLSFFIIAHLIAMKTYIPLFDWRPIANYVAQYHEKDMAFVRSYHNELGFYARLEKPVTDTTLEDLPKWFREHPDGIAIVRYKHSDLVKDYELLMSVPYREKDKYAGVFKAKAK